MHKLRTAALCGLLAGAGGAVFALPFPGNAELASLGDGGVQGDSGSYEGTISDNGRIVAWYSDSRTFASDTNGNDQIYVADRRRGVVTMISRDADGNPGELGFSFYPHVSAKGRYVLFYSSAPNLTGGPMGVSQVLLHDRAKRRTTLVSKSTAGGPSNGSARIYDLRPLSGDGRWAVFTSDATDLVGGDGNGVSDVFLADLRRGGIRRISRGIGGESNGASENVCISPNGRWITFTSAASNLVEGDQNGQTDTFLHDVRRGTTTLVSVATDGSQGDASGGTSSASVTADGRWVAFTAAATNFDAVTPDTNGRADVFLRDMESGTTQRMSIGPGDVEADGDGNDVGIDPKGRFLTWWTRARNLLPAPSTLQYEQVYCDVATGALSRMISAEGGGEVASSAGNYGYWAQLSANGRWFVVAVAGDTASSADQNGEYDVYLVDLKLQPPN